MPDHAREIEILIYGYAERMDAGDFAGVADLFRYGRIKTGPDLIFEGTERVKKMYERATRLYEDNGTPHTRHATTNVAVVVDDTAGTATARSYYTVFQQTASLALQPIIAGHYHDSFQRIGDEWCFDTREIFVDLMGDLSQHLLFDL